VFGLDLPNDRLDNGVAARFTADRGGDTAHLAGGPDAELLDVVVAGAAAREGIVQNLYYRWSKEFLEAGKKRLAGDTARAATSDEVKELRREASALKEVVAELTLENRLLKKSAIGAGEDGV